MVGWHHRLNGHEFDQTLGDSRGQGSLACHSPWACKEFDMTQRLNSNSGEHAACLSPPSPPLGSTGRRTASSWIRGTSCALRVTAHLNSPSQAYSVQAQGSDTDLCFPEAIFCILATLCPSELLG